MNIFRYIFIKRKSYLLINTIIFLLGIIGIIISFFLAERLNVIIMSIGTALVSSALVSFLELLRSSYSDIISNDVKKLVIEAGIMNVFDKRNLDDYDELIRKSHSIDITGYSLRAFSQSYYTIIKDEISKNSNFALRIILVNPECNASKERELIEYKKQNNQFKTSCEDVFSKFKDIEGVEIKLINFSLSSMIYRIDDIMYIGPHLVSETSTASFTMKIKKGGWAFKKYQKEFDALWEMAEPYNIHNKETNS